MSETNSCCERTRFRGRDGSDPPSPETGPVIGFQGRRASLVVITIEQTEDSRPNTRLIVCVLSGYGVLKQLFHLTTNFL